MTSFVYVDGIVVQTSQQNTSRKEKPVKDQIGACFRMLLQPFFKRKAYDKTLSVDLLS